MNLQIIHDSKVNPTGVFIPMQDWKRLKKRYAELAEYEVEEPTKEQLVAELKEAIQELQAVERGEKQARPLADLLNEL
jgi:phytoene/squalene synthetase